MYLCTKLTLSEQNRDKRVEGMRTATWGNASIDEVKVDTKRESQALRRRKKGKLQNLVLSQNQPYSFMRHFPRDFFQITINEKIFKEEKKK